MTALKLLAGTTGAFNQSGTAEPFVSGRMVPFLCLLVFFYLKGRGRGIDVSTDPS